jgi:hypothetical protein
MLPIVCVCVRAVFLLQLGTNIGVNAASRERSALLVYALSDVVYYLCVYARGVFITAVCSGTHLFCAAVASLTRPLHYKPTGHLSCPALIRPSKTRSTVYCLLALSCLGVRAVRCVVAQGALVERGVADRAVNVLY